MELHIPRTLVEGVMELAQGRHPKETILLLRGTTQGEIIRITETVLPPFAVGGKGFATFPTRALPFDLTLIGTLHSHPLGRLTPSTGDLHNFFGKIMIIIGPPYKTTNLIAYIKTGEKIPIHII